MTDVDGISVAPAMSQDKVFTQIQDVLPDCIMSENFEPVLKMFEGRLR